MKNILERIIAGLFLLLVLPVLLITIIIIRLESTGNPLFLQKRYGKGGKLFCIYKLRTMYQGEQLEDDSSPSDHRRKEYHRVTKFGLWLRKYHIDELPQLLNILKGDMAFVGPRPCPFFQVTEKMFYAPRDCNVLPGITGLWQISSVDGINCSLKEELDREYCQKKSFFYDLKIIVRTPIFILKKKFPPYLL